MRTISTADDKILTATGGRSVFWRAKVKDSGGTFRDLSTYAGRNMCVSATWKETIDSQGMDADITLKREVEKISVAPLMAGSPVNLAFAYPGSYSALLALAREVQIEVAMMPEGVAPASGDWNLQFHGYIDEIDSGEGEHVKLRCSDLQGKLRDTWMERERVYAMAQGVNATKGCIIWRPTDTVAVGDRVIPTDGAKNSHFYRATAITTGITGSTEPTWPTGGGATVVDGGVTWTESGSTSLTSGTAVETVMQQIIDDNLGAGVVTLNVPVSPSWAIKAYKPDRTSVWDALRVLVDQIGWDLRFRYDAGSSSFKLTFQAPNRSASTPDRTFSPSQRYKLARLPIQIAGIRNAVQVVYSDSSALDAAGRPTRKTVVRTDATSISNYGRRFCEIGEASTSNIDSATEANTLADNVISDLATPVVEHECDVPLFRFVELGDYYKWTADGIHYDSDQSLGVTSYTHKITDKEARTTIGCRGKPSAGFRRWHSKLNRDQHALDLTNSDNVTMTASAAIGGARFQLAGTETKGALPMNAEIHVSASPGFTPSSSTLKKQGASNDVVVSELIPGQTYYAKAVLYGHNRSRLVKSQPTREISFVAGQASSGHLTDGIALGDYPLNGGFETRVDTSGMPDHWSIVPGFGTYGTDVQVMEDGNGISGGRYLRLNGKVSGNVDIQSAMIPIINEAGEANRTSQLYRFSVWTKAASANTVAGALEIFVSLYDYAGSSVTVSSVITVLGNVKKGHWVKSDLYCRVDGGTSVRSAQVTLVANSTGTSAYTIDVDEIRLQWVGSPWYEIGTTTKFTERYDAIPGFQNSWVNYDAGTHTTAAFRWDRYGRIWLKGLIKSGTIGLTAFTLPVAPPQNVNFAVVANNLFGRVEIDTSGNVTPLVGNNAFVSLDGLNFFPFL